jgi:two-component system OmpR family response regulator
MSKDKIKLFLVDDDVVFLKSLEIDLLQHADFEIETFATGELCMEHLNHLLDVKHLPDVVILDYHLDGIDKKAMNGIELLDKILEFNPNLPIIMLSSQDKIDIAISCMHHKAFDYVVKSETAVIRLMQIISAIFKYKKMEKQLSWFIERM